MEKSNSIRVGDIVHLAPDCRNSAFAYCLMTVTEVKEWGVQGYVQALGDSEGSGGQAYYRAIWQEFEPTQGTAVWIAGSGHHESDEEPPIPFVAFGGEDLGEEVDGAARCPNCGQLHEVIYADVVKEDGTRVPSKLLGTVNCAGQSYLVSLGGRLIK